MDDVMSDNGVSLEPLASADFLALVDTPKRVSGRFNHHFFSSIFFSCRLDGSASPLVGLDFSLSRTEFSPKLKLMEDAAVSSLPERD